MHVCTRLLILMDGKYGIWRAHCKRCHQ